MQFTVVYEQKTVNRRRCMICDLLIADGDLAFFKGVAQGKAVHSPAPPTDSHKQRESEINSMIMEQMKQMRGFLENSFEKMNQRINQIDDRIGTT